MTRLSAVASVVLLFVSGLVVGVMGTHLFYASRLRDPRPMMMRMQERHVMRLEHHLDLTPEQAAAIDEVVARSREQAAELRGEMFPRIRELMDGTLVEIEAILTPEQRKDYERLRRFQRRGLEMFVLGPGGPGGPGGPRGPHRRGMRQGSPYR